MLASQTARRCRRFTLQCAFFALAAALLSAALCSPPACASGAPSGEIAFVRDGDIWVMDADGGNARQLTSTAADHQPVWSPDGRRLAFLRGSRQLWVMDADGSDARRVAFRLGLRAMPGTAHKKVTYSIAALDWAPDGSKLAVAAHAYSAYPSTAEGLNAAQIYLVRLKGTLQRRVGPLVYGLPERLSWRPTGSQMLLTQYYSMGYSSVKTFSLTKRRYSSTFGKTVVLSKAVWSPDGRRIAAERPDDQTYIGGSARLVVYDARTHARTDVLAVDRGYDWTLLHASWSPDGAWLACAVGDRSLWDEDGVSGIEIVPAGGGSSALVMDDGGEPAWRPAE